MVRNWFALLSSVIEGAGSTRYTYVMCLAHSLGSLRWASARRYSHKSGVWLDCASLAGTTRRRVRVSTVSPGCGSVTGFTDHLIPAHHTEGAPKVLMCTLCYTF